MKKEPIYIMTLELEKGNSKEIKIFSDSDANKITKEFCNENKIDLNSKKYLKEQIEELIKQFKNENNKNILNNKNKIIHKPFFNINKIEENKNPEFNNNKSEKIKLNSNKKKNKYSSKINNNNKEIIEKSLKKSNNSNSNKNFTLLNEPIRNKKNLNKKINHSKSLSNPSTLIKSNSNYINIKDKNIFDRLYKDGTLKRIFQCHSNSNEKNNKFNKIFTYENNKNKKKNNIILDENGKKINYGEYLYKREILNSKEKNKKNQKLKENEIKEKMKECSFNPKINNYNNNNNNNNKYKTKRKNNILNNDLIFTFKPKINNSYKSTLNFDERLNYFNTLYKEKKNNLNKYYNNFNFKTNINENKKKTITNNNNDNNNENVFEKNYQFAEKYNKNKELLKNKYNYNHLNNYKNISRNNNNSNSILNNFVDNLGSKIFKILDKDEDNLISAININLKIDKNVLNIINPLIFEIKNENYYLNENEFILAFKNFYKFLDFKDKNILQKFFYEKKNDNNDNNKHNIKFYINKNTDKLANKHDEKIEKKYFNLEKNIINKNQYFNKINKNNNEKNNENNENIHKFTFEINTKNVY